MAYAFKFLTPELRHCLDSLKIRYERRKIEFELFASCPCDDITITYQKYGRDTSIICKTTEISVEDNDFVEVFCEDLKNLLNRNIIFKYFFISFTMDPPWDEDFRQQYIEPIGILIFNYLKNYLQTRDSKLQVEHFVVQTHRMDHLMSVLPYLDKNTLKRVEVSYGNDDSPLLDANEILKLDLWNEYGNLELRAWSETLSFKTLVFVKEIFMNSSIFKYVIINYRKKFDETQLDQFFKDEHEGTVWQLIFEIPNTDLRVVAMTDGNVYTSFEKTNEFDPIRFRRPYDVQLPDNLLNPIKMIPLPLNDSRCLAVFENPMLLKTILKYLECFSIQSLRKVSSGIRNCVDTVKPEPYIEKVSIELNNTSIQIHLQAKNTETIQKTMEYYALEIFFKDLEKTLGHQKSCLEKLCLDFFPYSPLIDANRLKSLTTRFLEKLIKLLNSRDEPLRVEKLENGSLAQIEMIEVLPCINSTSLKTIEIRYAYKTSETHIQEKLEVNDEILSMEQWKHAEELLIRDFIVSTPIQQLQITHFAKGEIILATISSEDILHLKQGFLNSSSLIKFKIILKNSTVDQTIYDLMGFPYRMANPLLRNQKDIWFFRMPNIPNSVLHIVHNVSHSIIFSRVELSDIPEDLNLM